ncbi:MAG: hypothetical protein ACPGUE_05125 [Marinomonas sp.]
MMRVLPLFILSLVLFGCSHQSTPIATSNPPPIDVTTKLDFVQKYLALASFPQAGAILSSFTSSEQSYLSQHSLDYLRLKGVYLTQTKQVKKAEKHYQTAVKSFPNDIVLLNNYGVFLLGNEHFVQACNYFEKVVLLSSQNSFSGLINLSRCELGFKKVDMARMYLQRAKEINNLPYIGLLTELNLALILGDLSGARQSYNKIQAKQKNAPYIEHKNEYECLLQQFNAAELDSTHYSSSRPPFACVVQGIEYGIWNSRKQ